MMISAAERNLCKLYARPARQGQHLRNAEVRIVVVSFNRVVSEARARTCADSPICTDDVCSNMAHSGVSVSCITILKARHCATASAHLPQRISRASTSVLHTTLGVHSSDANFKPTGVQGQRNIIIIINCETDIHPAISPLPLVPAVQRRVRFPSRCNRGGPLRAYCLNSPI